MHVKKIKKRNKKIRIGTLLLFIYFVLAPLDFIPILHGISVSKIIIFIPLFGTLFCLKNMRLYLDKFSIILILYILLLLGNSLYSVDVYLSINRSITIGLNLGVVIFLSMQNYDNLEIDVLKKGIVFSGWLTIILMIFYSGNNLFGGRASITINGTSQDPNYLNGFLIFAIIYYLDDYMKKNNIISFIKMFVFLIFILLTGSRGGTLSIICSILFYIFLKMKDIKFTISSLIILLGLIFAMILVFNITLSFLPDTISRRYNPSYTINDNGAHRIDIWISIFENYKNASLFNKIFGSGAGTIKYFTYSGNVAHNIWIEALMEVGVIGLFVLFLLYYTYFQKSCKMKEYVLASSFFGYIVMGMSLSLYSYKPIWNIILLILIVKNNKKKSQNSVRQN